MRGVFPKLSETPGGVDHAGPELGAHARDVLREEAGLSDATSTACSTKV